MNINFGKIVQDVLSGEMKEAKEVRPIISYMTNQQAPNVQAAKNVYAHELKENIYQSTPQGKEISYMIFDESSTFDSAVLERYMASNNAQNSYEIEAFKQRVNILLPYVHIHMRPAFMRFVEEEFRNLFNRGTP